MKPSTILATARQVLRIHNGGNAANDEMIREHQARGSFAGCRTRRDVAEWVAEFVEDDDRSAASILSEWASTYS